LDQLGVDDVQAFYAALTNRGLSPRTVRFCHAVLRSALAHAVKRNMLPRNPADDATLPKSHRHEMRCLDRCEAQRFLAAAETDQWSALWILLITTGLRPGEACALKWTDLSDTRLSIQRTLVPGYRGTWQLDEPKTARSVRSIPLPPSAVRALVRHRANQAAERLRAGASYKDLDFVFANSLGDPLHPEVLSKRPFHRILQAAGLPQIRMYDLRHTAATLLLAAGENPKVVSERLGHASITLTLDTYSHVLPDMQQAAADKLERMLFA